MPYYRKRRRRAAKKRYVKKRRWRPKRKTNRIVRWRNPIATNGFPTRYAARLKYTQFVTLDMTSIGSGVGVQSRFRANSLYAPSYDVAGHQPRGYDQLSRIYDHYVVIGSKIKVSFNQDVDTVQNCGMYCFVNISDTANPLPTLIDMCEARKSNCKYMPRDTVGSRPVHIVETYSPYKMFGLARKDSLIANDRLNTQVSTNPLEDAIFAVGVICERTTTTDPAPIIARVDIEFMGIFTELRPIPES